MVLEGLFLPVTRIHSNPGRVMFRKPLAFDDRNQKVENIERLWSMPDENRTEILAIDLEFIGDLSVIIAFPVRRSRMTEDLKFPKKINVRIKA